MHLMRLKNGCYARAQVRAYARAGGFMSEKQAERRLADGVKKYGGLCPKFVSPGMPGVPDRIVLTADGRVIFVELKSEGGRLSALQRHVIREMSRRGHEVRVLYGIKAVDEFLSEVFGDEV